MTQTPKEYVNEHSPHGPSGDDTGEGAYGGGPGVGPGVGGGGVGGGGSQVTPAAELANNQCVRGGAAGTEAIRPDDAHPVHSPMSKVFR